MYLSALGELALMRVSNHDVTGSLAYQTGLDTINIQFAGLAKQESDKTKVFFKTLTKYLNPSTPLNLSQEEQNTLGKHNFFPEKSLVPPEVVNVVFDSDYPGMVTLEFFPKKGGEEPLYKICIDGEDNNLTIVDPNADDNDHYFSDLEIFDQSYLNVLLNLVKRSITAAIQ